MSVGTSPIYVSLDSAQYSSAIQQRAKDALVHLFPQLAQESAILKIDGHRIDVIHQSGTETIQLEAGTKKVLVMGREALTGKKSIQLRRAIKELQEHARDIVQVNLPTAQQPKAVDGPAPSPMIATVQKIGYPLVDIIGVLRNAIDLVKIILLLTVVCAQIAQITHAIGGSIAGLRIFQGCLSLLMGSIRLTQAVQAYRHAKAVHDINGMEIAKRQIINQAIVLCEGLLWISVGILFLSVPQVGLSFTILQWVLFYGGFALDSALTITKNQKAIDSMQQYYRTFKEGVLENKNLSLEEKREAARRFLKRTMDVTPEEEKKIREKSPDAVDLRLKQKIAKKRLIAARMGLTEEVYRSVKNGSVDALTKIQECFEKSLGAEKASRFLAIVCLLVNVSGLQFDLPDMTGWKDLLMGIPVDILVAANDFLWVVVNAMYLAEEEICDTQFSRLFTKKVKPLEDAPQVLPKACPA